MAKTEVTREQEEFRYVPGRIKFMQALKDKTEPLYRRRRFPESWAVRFLELVLIGSSELNGADNLRFVDKYKTTKRITFAGNHSSDTDHSALENALIQNNQGSVADHLLFPAGLKMWDRPQVSWGMWGMNTFPTAAPGYYETAEELTKIEDLPEDRKNMLTNYVNDLNWLTKASFEAVLSDWREGKAFVVVYPETTRSRNGFIQRGKLETGAYFKRGVTMPFLIEGPENAFPPESDPDWGLILSRRWKNTVTFGPPIDAEALWKPATSDWLREKGANQVDFVMSRVAILNPGRVDSKYRSLYNSLTQDIPQGLLLAA